ncbi:MAG: hypothetical protein AAFR58_00680 [Cyanobacteria bacterium J06627_28]
MSDLVLSQLVSVESDLAAQVDQLEAQLTQIQAQRQGLRTVIDLFESSDGSAAPTTSTTKQKTTAPEASGRTSTAKKTSTSKTSIPKTSTSKTKTKKKNKPGPKATKATAGRKKKDGRAADWQKHVQSELREVALPEAVSSVLRSQPSEIFKIKDVMTAIFKPDMPKTSYLKARNRISNILSAGARDGTWYRGSNGRYSQSESVTKA